MWQGCRDPPDRYGKELYWVDLYTNEIKDIEIISPFEKKANIICEMQKKIASDIIYLISCVVNNRKPDKHRVAVMNHEAILSFASTHMISTITAIALESAGVKSPLTAGAIVKGVRRDCFFEKAWAEISAKLEDNSIWYLPIKGAILKNYYQKPGMREYSDYDILFDKTMLDKVKDIMLSLGFEMEHDDTGHDIVFCKKPVLNFEMHTHLFGIGHEQIMNDYYDNIHDRLIKDSDNKFGYHMSNEDFYIYMIAHEYKHYSTSGTGLRSLMDTYVFTSSVEVDRAYVDMELKKLGIAIYEQQNYSLAKKLFTGEQLNYDEEKMFEYIISSGTYGTMEHGIEHKLEKNGGSKIKYILSRFFVPISKNDSRYLSFSKMYPKFYKNKLSICLLPFYRTYQAIKNKKLKRELNVVIHAKSNN